MLTFRNSAPALLLSDSTMAGNTDVVAMGAIALTSPLTEGDAMGDAGGRRRPDVGKTISIIQTQTTAAFNVMRVTTAYGTGAQENGKVK